MAEPPDWCKPGAQVIVIHPDRHFLRKGEILTVRETLATPHRLKSDCLIGLEERMPDLQLWGLWRFRRYTPGTGQEAALQRATVRAKSGAQHTDDAP